MSCRIATASRLLSSSLAFVSILAVNALAHGDSIWVEGEKPASSTMQRHPYWYDQVKRQELSGGDLISNFGNAPGEATYQFTAQAAGEYEFWVRANPIQAKLSYQLNDGSWTPVDVGAGTDSINIAADGKPDLRFLAWMKAGTPALKKGTNSIRFRMDSANNNHGFIDCFVFTTEAFTPQGTIKPEQLAAARSKAAKANKGWFAFHPPRDPYSKTSGINLRSLNEKTAGDGGFIGVKGSRFIHTKTGEPVRFWAVNVDATQGGMAEHRAQARMLAKHGVNLVRVQGAYFDETGAVKPSAVRRAFDIVAAMKAEGIYTHFSVYFPLWLTPKPGNRWLAGYDGKHKAFAVLFFNKDFQRQYLEWWKALLLTPNPSTGLRLIDEPAVAGLEILNEDSYFFWTFASTEIPDTQLQILETEYGSWLKKKYGSTSAALEAWGGVKDARDRPSEGRMGFRHLWNMSNERTPRDKDAARFLVESQRGFYTNAYRYLRRLGYQGLISASNWATASAEILGPLEKYTYTATDFIDRHGYFDCHLKGENASWSVANGHTFADRSALRFDPEEPGKPKSYLNPVMDITYDDKPSVISETSFVRPNRYRSEAPLMYAAYGALQDSDGIVHFSLDSVTWSTKPNYFMQPWTLMSPAMIGQFPATALIYRKGLVATGDLVVDLNLKLADILDLKGTPMPQDALLDELRLKDVPSGTSLKPGNVIDPLVHMVGRTNVNFSERGAPAVLKDLSPFVDHNRQVVTSTTGQLRLDYAKGVLTIDAPSAQAVSGALRAAGTTELKDLEVSSKLELGHIVAVALDDKPLAQSSRILLQVMSEEKNSDFATQPTQGGQQRITNIGHDPWLAREIDGLVKLKRPDAERLKVVALDWNGDPVKAVGNASAIRLLPTTLYYLITP